MATSLREHFTRALRLRRAVRLSFEAAPQAFVANLALWVIQGALPLLTLLVLKALVDSVAPGAAAALLGAGGAPGAGAAGTGAAPDGAAAGGGIFTLGSVVFWVALLGVLAVLAAWIQSVSGLLSEAQGQRVADHVAEVLHAKSLELDLEYYDNPHYYDVLYRAQQEAPYRPFSIVNALGRLGQSGLALFGIAGLLAALDWRLAAAVLLAAVPGALVRLSHSRTLYRWRRRRTEDERRAHYYQQMLVGAEHAKEARVFGFGPLVRSWFRELRQRLRGEQEGLLRGRARLELLAQALGLLPVFFVLGQLALRTLDGRATLGDLVLYYTAVQRGLGYFSELMSALASLYENSLFLANFEEFLALEARVTDPKLPKPLPEPILEGLRLENVSFRYPRSEKATLDGVSLEIRPGQVVALVGANGAGKTTLVKLLCRLYDPSAGRVLLDGIPLDAFELAPLRARVSVVFQDFARYNLTLRENVWLGDVGEERTDPRVEAAAALAGADRVAARLPAGYDTLLGHWLEGGHELSFGEWQRVALARTLFRDSWLVVLDEPTASLDALAEQRFWEQVRGALAGRAVLLISHRFSAVRQADHIYVLEGGRVAESGTHAELVARGGNYAGLYAAQAKYYE